LLIHTTDPLNAEPALSELTDSFVTPVDRFFKRNHAPVPAVDAASYRLAVGGLVEEEMVLTLEDLGRFPRVELAATLQCAGNRRQDLIDHAPTPGEVPWRDAAIGNAVWGGWRLADVLRSAGVRAGARHAAFSGMDRLPKGGRTVDFGASIPLAKALSPEVLLADTMNGEPLRPEHGFPLRVLVPGFIGARSVKWLERITLQEAESENHFQRRAYRLFPPDEDGSTADWDARASIEDFPVSAVITRPAAGETFAAGAVRLVGYAITGGGRRILSVEVSADDGASWAPARVSEEGNEWTWRFWEAELTLPPGRHVLAARATDEAGGQPADVASVWNWKGYLNNSWHRVRVVAR
jgi:sulfite oxidase